MRFYIRPIGMHAFVVLIEAKVLEKFAISIMLTCPCNSIPLSQHCYIVTLEFTGVCSIFIIWF